MNAATILAAAERISVTEARSKLQAAGVFQVACAWWALCDKPADRTEPHPVLGNVPICKRCSARLRALEAR